MLNKLLGKIVTLTINCGADKLTHRTGKVTDINHKWVEISNAQLGVTVVRYDSIILIEMAPQ